jgi:hypothetical protein
MLRLHSFIRDCKSHTLGRFILAKVDIEKLCISASAGSESGWEDLNKKVDIPLNLLDPVELAAAVEGKDGTDMISLS